MSGFFPSDIARWALGGRDPNEADQTNNNNGVQDQSSSSAPLSEEEMRARRMARLASLENKSSIESDPDGTKDNNMEVERHDAMEVDAPCSDVAVNSTKKNIAAAKSTNDGVAAANVVKNETAPMSTEPAAKKQATKKPALTPSEKMFRKKSQLLRKVLLVSLNEDTPGAINLNLTLDTTSTGATAGQEKVSDWGVHQIAEILASRLSIEKDDSRLDMARGGGGNDLIAYLCGCYKRSWEEWRELQGKKRVEGDEELLSILVEMRGQVVSYAASSLMIPDLFDLASDSTLQLAKALTTTTTDPANSITFDVNGKSSSFYYCLCEELYSQDVDSFERVISDVVGHIAASLAKCETILDEGYVSDEAPLGRNALFLTSALRELCSHKKATIAFTKMKKFCLPAPNTAEASERITPPIPTPPPGATAQQIQLFQMMQRMSNNSRTGYIHRSGPGIEKQTILGMVLRQGLPESNPSVSASFSNAATRTKKDVNQSVERYRRALEFYQNKCNELVKQLVIAGEDARKMVIRWFTDALLVNVNAGGTRPDRTKVSSTEFLLNLSVVLLKLCEPIINDHKKTLLVDPGFVNSPKDHGGVYDLAGNDHLPRLGENIDTNKPYQPDNSFIPFCFFFCSRALALSIVPEASAFENINYHARRTAWTIQQQNGDVRSDPRLNQILGIQYSREIHMMSPGYVTEIFRFFNMAGGVLLRIDKDELKAMPEHIVADYCSVLDYGAEFTPTLLSGIDFGNIFRLTVKLLSKDYANLVRNYNLRAKLGDVLHDIFLPSSGDDRSDVPRSVSCDPLAGGQPYLTSDKLAQETLAPSLLLLYGEVEHTGFYEKNSHRTKIAKLLKFLWESPEHKPAFRRITEDKTSFQKFANGIVNEMNDQFASVMERLPAIRTVQLQMANHQEWAALSEEDRETITSRHEENEQQVKRVLPLCNSVMKMLGFLNTDKDIRDMFLLPEMCPRLANMLLHVLTKFIGARGMDLKVDNPESYNFRPKDMLQDVCVVFSSFAAASEFQLECAKSGYYTPELMGKAVKTCRKLNLLIGESMELFALLETKVAEAAKLMAGEEDLYEDAPDEFMDPLLSEFMTDPVLLPTSGHIVDRKTITQHLLNDSMDPFNRKELKLEDVVPAVELKERIDAWLKEKRDARMQSS
ncbi:hypothetical protein HJC23_004792 [Cyclotella cryptica]|uniref:RING-type E3 ubiquitin transferase n=1 Tax=Cyclotella cryptica TaxID=29204 RepID=A0ABD3PXX1_9STRA|eukprot:CCRYP_010427-RB/>CCRYP_010427-RB protein AED:0.02 eAED:0.02 QI:4002/1/0.93/1/0.35/0.26/15/3949/1153